jgi:hypothetical protein
MQSNKKTKSALTIAAIAGAILFGGISSIQISATGQFSGPFRNAFADDSNGLIVPMYGWDAGWSELIHAKKENKATKIIAVINPSSGSGTNKDSHWKNVVDDLQDEGIKVVGYVATSYGGRSLDRVKDEIHNYYRWYDLDGIFLDEVSGSEKAYYKSIDRFAEKPHGPQIVILNPGAPVPKSYSSVADIIVAYENSGIPYKVESNGIKESQLAALVHGTEPGKSEFKDLSASVGYLYVSPDWMHVSSLIEHEADWANG